MADISQVKVGSTNYDLKDATARSGNVPNGGTQGQTLMKASATDKDTEWRMPTYHFQTKAALDAAIANGDIPANGALATVDENPPVGIEGDTALSTTSENWVQNKVVTTAINGVNSDLSDKADKTAISNPNLLDNPWFTVNQRGATTCAANTYGVDRWRPIRMTYTVNADKSLTLVGENVATNIDYLCQRFPKGELDDLIGKTATLSILLSSNEVVSATFTSVTTETIDVGDYQFAFDYGSSSFDLVRVGFKKGSSISTMTIKAVKLELGSISTLAMDTAPNYPAELLKCQRYFQRIGTDDSHTLVIGSGHCYGTYLMFNTFLPVPMRTNPALTVDGGVSVCRINVNGSSKVVTSFSGVSLTNNIISMLANTASDIGLNSYAGDVHIRAESGNTLSLNFIADL